MAKGGKNGVGKKIGGNGKTKVTNLPNVNKAPKQGGGM